MRKPKVLILGQLPPPYFGPAVATRIILNSSLKDHYFISHLDTNIHETISTLGQWGIDKIGKNLKLYATFIIRILREKPDLVFIPISQTTIGFLKDSGFILLARFLGKKLLLQLRGSNFKNWVNCSGLFTRPYISWVLRQAEGMVVLGRNLKYIFADYYQDDHIFVVPNGVNMDFHVDRRDGDLRRILYLSNLRPQKGIEDVLEALVQLKDGEDIEIPTDVVGEWKSHAIKKTCYTQVQNHGLSVTFHPSACGDRKIRFFEQADLFIFPPRDPEGHPWVIVEAMAAGLPIITTDQGAIIESVKDGVNGFIVRKKSPGQIAEKIKYLMDHPEIRIKMGEESRRLYLENFTEEKMVEGLSYAFNSVLNR